MARTKPYSRRSSRLHFTPEVRTSAASSAPSYTHRLVNNKKAGGLLDHQPVIDYLVALPNHPC